MKKIKSFIATVMFALCMMSMVAAQGNQAIHADAKTIADSTKTTKETLAITPSNGVMPLSEDYYNIGDPSDRFTRVFLRTSGYHGPITIQIMGYNSSDYVTDIMVYGTSGLLFSQDDWMGGGNLKVVNSDGSMAVQSISLRIRPRPKFLFQSPAKNFSVKVSW